MTRCITKIILLTSICTIFLVLGYTQPFIGQREIQNFQKKYYNAGTQNWSIKQDAEGRLYFANNEGLLVYDGTYWKLLPLPNKTIVWSIEFGKDNRLYVGGQDEMGFFAPDKSGKLSYTSLKTLLDEGDQKFADVWNIISLDKDVFFRCNAKLFKYHNNNITVYQPWSSWIFLGMHQKQLLAHDEGKGLLIYQSGRWESLIDKSLLPKDFYITSITPFAANTSLITTFKNGLFLLKDNKLTPFILNGGDISNLQYQHFTSSTKIDENNYLIGTYNNGFYHINHSGNIVEHFAKEDGLQNNSVKSLFTDKNNNIWLGLSDGIDFIPYNSAVKHIDPKIFNDGAGYSVTSYGNNLYFALSNGIYKIPLEQTNDLSYLHNNTKIIAEGQTWNIFELNGKLLAGREEGLFNLTNNLLVPVDKATGYWTFQPVKKGLEPLYAAGNYQGVDLFSESNGNFYKKKGIPNLNTSARFLAIDSVSNIIWVSHPYRGVYKINLNNDSVKLYTLNNGLPSTLNNHVYKIKNQILIATEKGIYEYNAPADRFIPSAFYEKIFNDISVRYLKEDTEGNIWFVHEKSIGVVDFSKKTPSIIYLPELKNRILSGFENIYPVNKNNIFVGGEMGFYHINYETYKQNIHPLQVYINEVKIKNETEKLIFGGYYRSVNNDSNLQTIENIPDIQYSFNSIHFEYSSPFYEQQSNLEYSYYLKGFDRSWSDWTKKTEKDYTNLPAGNYLFQIKVRNNLNTESKITTYSFHILTPWYNSIWAWFIYLLIATGALYLLYKKQEKEIHKKQEKKLLEERKRYEEEQRNIAYLHQLALEKSEKELVQLKNEKLESEIEFKNSELASTAMNLVQKKEFLIKIKEELNKINQINKLGKDTIETSELKKILRSLTEDEKLNDEWEQFSIHFNKVHGDFLVILKEKFSDLKPHELKLCAYLRMNLSSKEIAHLMSISVRGVEISRYRLRKKLQLPTDTNLFQFLFEIESAGRKNNNEAP